MSQPVVLAAEPMYCPGATISGLNLPSCVGPSLENLAILSVHGSPVLGICGCGYVCVCAYVCMCVHMYV